MHHPHPADLEPARPLADPAAGVGPSALHALDVQLHRGLREGKVAGAEAVLQAPAEEGVHQAAQRALQDREGHVFVDHQALDLVEHRGMRGIVVPPVHLPGADDPQRRAVLQHRAHLHGRRVRAQQGPVREIEGVLHVAGRVPGGHVQALEVVELLLLLGPQGDGVPHPLQDLHDLVHRLGHGVEGPAAAALRGQRHVDALPGLARLVLPRAKLAPPGLDRPLHLVPEGVQLLAGRGTLLGAQLPQRLQQNGQRALLPQVAHPQLAERLRGVNGGQRLIKRGPYLPHSFHQRIQPPLPPFLVKNSGAERSAGLRPPPYSLHPPSSEDTGSPTPRSYAENESMEKLPGTTVPERTWPAP